MSLNCGEEEEVFVDCWSERSDMGPGFLIGNELQSEEVYMGKEEAARYEEVVESRRECRGEDLLTMARWRCQH